MTTKHILNMLSQNIYIPLFNDNSQNGIKYKKNRK